MGKILSKNEARRDRNEFIESLVSNDNVRVIESSKTLSKSEEMIASWTFWCLLCQNSLVEVFMYNFILDNIRHKK